MYAKANKTEGPKLGLQASNRHDRRMSFENLMFQCLRSGEIELTAWPVDLKEQAPEAGIPATFRTDGTRHILRGWRRAKNEMEDAIEVSVNSPNLEPIKEMLIAKIILFGVQGISMALPKPNVAVRNFISACENFSNQH